MFSCQRQQEKMRFSNIRFVTSGLGTKYSSKRTKTIRTTKPMISIVIMPPSANHFLVWLASVTGSRIKEIETLKIDKPTISIPKSPGRKSYSSIGTLSIPYQFPPAARVNMPNFSPPVFIEYKAVMARTSSPGQTMYPVDIIPAPSYERSFCYD